MQPIFRTIFIALTLLLASCQAMEEPIPLETIDNLSGLWQQIDGKASVRFYEDESVKLALPDEHPPFKVLSTLETMKDNQLGFGIGDRWSGPIRVEPASDWQSIVLIFPGDNEERRATFIKVSK